MDKNLEVLVREVYGSYYLGFDIGMISAAIRVLVADCPTTSSHYRHVPDDR